METPEGKKSKVLNKAEIKPNELLEKSENVGQSTIKLGDLGATLGKTLIDASAGINLSGLDTGAPVGRTLNDASEAMRLSLDTGKAMQDATKAIKGLSYWSSLKKGEDVWSNVAGISERGSKIGSLTSFSQPSSHNQVKLIGEIADLKLKLFTVTQELTAEADNKQKVMTKYIQLTEELQAKEKINHIIPRIREEARKKLLESSEFLALFNDAKSCEAVVVSIDIRRSTELMLKARKPELFSKFITELSSKLSENIISNYGIFDKFTGDGILAFFPDFYSGDEAIIRALKSAEECHEIFDKHYHDSKSCFNVFINDVGLGIGIDFGTVTLVNTSNELTVVGIPVVYACRMSGANAGDTILNQPAKEEIERLCANQIKITDTTILIKNEGTAEVYKVDVNPSVYKAMVLPSWTIDVQNGEVVAGANTNTNDEVSE